VPAASTLAAGLSFLPMKVVVTDTPASPKPAVYPKSVSSC
jgi:hypothetical protein